MVWWNPPPGEADENEGDPETAAPLSEEETHLRESLARARKLVEQGIPEGKRLVAFFQSALSELEQRRKEGDSDFP